MSVNKNVVNLTDMQENKWLNKLYRRNMSLIKCSKLIKSQLDVKQPKIRNFNQN